MITKNYRGFLFLLIFYRLIIDGFAGVRFLLMGELKHLKAILEAHFDYYKEIKHYLKVRDDYRKQSQGKENNIGYYKRSIVIEKFVRKNTKFSELEDEDFYSPN